MQRSEDDTLGGEALAEQALAARGLPVPLDEAKRRRWQDEFNAHQGMQYIGCRLDLSDPRVVRVHLPEIQAHHLGGLGTDAVNGAVLAGFFDIALGVAGVLQFPGKRAGTVDLSIKFMRPTLGSSITAYAVALKRTENIAFVESELYSGNRLCAIASGMVSRTATESKRVDEVQGGHPG
jgi:acyl-coenzyme A thioesterase PaaI-like protein